MSSVRGITLIQLVLGSALVITVVFAISMGFSSLNEQAKKRKRSMELVERSSLLGSNLKQYFEGTQSFQGVSFRISSTPNRGSQGAGFYVEPDTDFNGNVTQNIDRIHVLTSSRLIQMTLSSHYTSGASSLTVKASEGVTVSEVLKVGDLALLSDIQTGEVVKITSIPAATNEATLTLNTASFVHTFIPPAGAEQLQRNYASGDRFYPLRLTTIGLDSTSYELRSSPFGLGSYTVLEKDVTSFQILYNLEPSTSKCNTISTASETFERSGWSSLNSDSDMSCYTRLKSIRILFTIGDKKGEYTFRTNN